MKKEIANPKSTRQYTSLQKIEKRAIPFDSNTKLFFFSLYSSNIRKRERFAFENGALMKQTSDTRKSIGGCSANNRSNEIPRAELERLWSGTRYPYRSRGYEDRIERRIVSSSERNHRSLIARLLKYYLIPARSEHLAIVQRNLHRLLLPPLSLRSRHGRRFRRFHHNLIIDPGRRSEEEGRASLVTQWHAWRSV